MSDLSHLASNSEYDAYLDPAAAQVVVFRSGEGTNEVARVDVFDVGSSPALEAVIGVAVEAARRQLPGEPPVYDGPAPEDEAVAEEAALGEEI